jgi:hypothetical protein
MGRREFLSQSAVAAAAAFVGIPESISGQVRRRSFLPKSATRSGEFIHPGIFQTRKDLEFMKAQIVAAKEPWIGKWNQLLTSNFSDLSFAPRPVAHVLREAFGATKSGSDELQTSVDAANSHVKQWYVTGDAAHAEKAAMILDAWADALWGFDGNDAKLLAGWTGAPLCEVGEILRSTYPSWGSARVKKFHRLLTDVYLPLLQDYFPEANGNWDAAIMHSLAAIGIFTDDRQLFDGVVHRFKLGPGNGGITKYVYPNGQCEESTRDMGHTQLGLGYFALTASICWNQGVDLFSAADDRLAFGFEYTSKYMLGEDVPHFGPISVEGRGQFSDFYEAAYQHYRYVQGRSMPYTERAVLKARDRARSTLSMYRGEGAHTPRTLMPAPVLSNKPLAGALPEGASDLSPDVVRLKPGQALQPALDAFSGKKGTVFLEAGEHRLAEAVRIPSRATILGAGRSTIVSLGPKSAGYCFVAEENDLQDIELSDFVIEGATSAAPPSDPNQDRRARSLYNAAARGGIRLASDSAGAVQNVKLKRMTIRNATLSGILLEGIRGVFIEDCDLSNSGGSVSPGAGQHHNLAIHHCSQVVLTGSRLADSMLGCGLSAISVEKLTISDCEVSRNRLAGLRFSGCEAVSVSGSLLEGNDGLGLEWLEEGRLSHFQGVKECIVRFNGAETLL